MKKAKARNLSTPLAIVQKVLRKRNYKMVPGTLRIEGDRARVQIDMGEIGKRVVSINLTQEDIEWSRG